MVACIFNSAALVAATAALTVAATSSSDGPGMGVGPRPQAIIVRIRMLDATMMIGDCFIGYLLAGCVDRTYSRWSICSWSAGCAIDCGRFLTNIAHFKRVYGYRLVTALGIRGFFLYYYI
jgi:hypothetical protein